MIGSVTTAASVQPTGPVNPAPTSSKPAASSKPASGSKPSSAGGGNDTVHLSSAAQAQLKGIKAVLQEATETPAQTAQEAMGGDIQAQRLLAREARAAAQSGQHNPSTVRGR